MKLFILLFPFLLFTTIQAFRVKPNTLNANNTHVPCSNRRNKPLELFGCTDKSLSKCPVLNSLSAQASYLNKKVNQYVPGGWLTTVSLPLASYFAYKWFFKRKAPERVNTNLHRYQCTGCGYVIFPAKNREEKFFSESFTCPNCGSPRSRFTEKYK